MNETFLITIYFVKGNLFKQNNSNYFILHFSLSSHQNQ